MNKLKIRTVWLGIMTVLTVSAGVFSAFLYSNAVVSTLDQNLTIANNGTFGGTLVVSNGGYPGIQTALTVAQGRVGFGTLAPDYALDVRGTISASSNIIGQGIYSNTVSAIAVSGYNQSTGDGVYGYSFSGTGIDGYSASGYGVRGYSSSGIAGWFYSNTGYGLIVEKGNVGIGTISPAVPLHVNGSAVATGASISKHGTHLNARFTCAGGITNVSVSSFTCNDPRGKIYKGNAVYTADNMRINYDVSRSDVISERICWALGGSKRMQASTVNVSLIDNSEDVVESYGGDVYTNNAPTFFYPKTYGSFMSFQVLDTITCAL